MHIKNNKKVTTQTEGYKIHISGNRATIESPSLDNLQQVIMLAT